MKKPPVMESIIISMNFPLSLPLFVGHYLLQSLEEGICEALRLWCTVCWTPTYVWFCDGVLERSGWKPLNLHQSFVWQLSAFRSVFFSGLKCRQTWSVSGVYPCDCAAGVFVAGEAFGAKDTLWLCQLWECEGREKLLACSLPF